MLGNNRYKKWLGRRVIIIGIIMAVAYLIFGGVVPGIAAVIGFLNVFAGCGLMIGVLFLVQGSCTRKSGKDWQSKTKRWLKILFGGSLALSEVMLLASFKVLGMIGWGELFVPIAALGAVLLAMVYRLSMVSRGIQRVVEKPASQVRLGLIIIPCLLGSLFSGGLALTSDYGLFLCVLYIATTAIVGAVGLAYLGAYAYAYKGALSSKSNVTVTDSLCFDKSESCKLGEKVDDSAHITPMQRNSLPRNFWYMRR